MKKKKNQQDIKKKNMKCNKKQCNDIKKYE